jgi:hypothetical protein
MEVEVGDIYHEILEMVSPVSNKVTSMSLSRPGSSGAQGAQRYSTTPPPRLGYQTRPPTFKASREASQASSGRFGELDTLDEVLLVSSAREVRTGK